MNAGRKYEMALVALLAGLVSGPSYGLEIDIQGTTLQTESVSELCLNIAGEYDGVRIEDSEVGKVARMCQQTKQNNLMILSNANFVATKDNAVITVRFHNDFAPRLNGPTIGRVGLDGFFATSIGTEAPSGDRVELKGYLNQETNDDLIEEALIHTVGDANDLESAVFELQTEKNYLVAGRRTLKGELTIAIAKTGNQMVVRAIRVSLDPPWFIRPRTAE
ncbi:hypothetical protein N9H39_05545 [Gammaproteobacteria bacterium]|nr:hypothetical protein [Gammaproteobacteria bacterium]